MSNEEIKTLIEQEAKRFGSTASQQYRMAGFFQCWQFLEKILPEVLKEKDAFIENRVKLVDSQMREIVALHAKLEKKDEKMKTIFEALEKTCGENESLQAELSQLQSKMEEEKRQAAIEFAEWVNFKDIMQTNDGMWWRNNPAFRDKHFAQSTEHLFTLFKRETKSSTQSTESGNLNKQ